MQINLSTRQLRAFLALARESNFTRAAAASHLSQPAFSALIGQLEESLGTRLFDRSTRRVELSAEGEVFAVAARRVLDEMEAAISAVEARVNLRSGRVSVALLPSLAADWLPQVLAGFRQRHPGVEVAVSDVLSDACIEAVRSGRADFALAAKRADTAELQTEPFCADAFHLVCPVGHELSRARRITPGDVAAFPFIHLSRTSSVRQYLDAATHPLPLPSILEVDQLATVAGMVAAGLGVSIVPALALYQFRSAALAVRPVRWPGLKRHIYVVRRRERELSVAAGRFHAWALAHRPRGRTGRQAAGGDRP